MKNKPIAQKSIVAACLCIAMMVLLPVNCMAELKRGGVYRVLMVDKTDGGSNCSCNGEYKLFITSNYKSNDIEHVINLGDDKNSRNGLVYYKAKQLLESGKPCFVTIPAIEHREYLGWVRYTSGMHYCIGHVGEEQKSIESLPALKNICIGHLIH